MPLYDKYRPLCKIYGFARAAFGVVCKSGPPTNPRLGGDLSHATGLQAGTPVSIFTFQL